MVNSYVQMIGNAEVPQSAPLDARQVRNNAGGFVFEIDDWARLDRFLVLGSDANTYYQTARALTRENAACVARCFAADAARTIARIVEVSHGGRAPRNDPAIFALALGAAHGDVAVRQAALAVLPRVCRTSTHLFQFVGAVTGLGRGWGRSLKTAVARWYDAKGTDALAYQMVKYRNREGYTHKRLLQTAHPSAHGDAARLALYRWARGLDHDADTLPRLVTAHLQAMQLGGPTPPTWDALEQLLQGARNATVAGLVAEHRLPWEALPTEARADPGVWATMLPDMGLTALIRNLGVMTANGTLSASGANVAVAVARLRDAAGIVRARVHPFTILQALAVYRSGRGVRGSLTWSPVPQILAALDDAFYLAFRTIEPTAKRIMLALDVSGSMGSAFGGSLLTCREAAAALAMSIARTEEHYTLVGFTADNGQSWSQGATLTALPITADMRLDEVVRITSSLPFGGTDCALPMLEATATGLEVDAFVVVTDNETWAGRVHPVQALREYRRTSGIQARLCVVGMTATDFTIADPADAGMLDVVGFDSACPALIADFIGGRSGGAAAGEEAEE